MQVQLSVAGRRVLWLMLGLLAATSIGAILIAIFKPDSDAGLESIYVIAFTTAVASGLVLAVGWHSESRQGQRTRIFVLSLVLVQYVLSLALIWTWYRSSDQEIFFTTERMAPVALGFLAAAIPAAGFFQVAQTREGKYAGWVGLILCGTVWILNVLGGLLPDKLIAAFPWCETSMVCWLLAIILAGCLAGVGTDRRHWRWLGVVAALVASAFTVQAMWSNANISSFRINAITMIAVLVAQANLLFQGRLTRRQGWVRWVALVAAVAMSVAWLANDWKAPNSGNPTVLEQIQICSCICAACASVSVAVLTRTNVRPFEIDPFVQSTNIGITCPKCGVTQTVGLGESCCCGCGTHFSIAAREPQCPECGYRLRMIDSDRCPECGKVIPWKAHPPAA